MIRSFTWRRTVRGIAPQLRDQVWLRILDVPGALAARSYGADIDEVIQVSDDHIAENSQPWRLRVRDGRAAVALAERDASASVRMSIQDLSAAYLGGTTIESIAAAGLIEEVRPGFGGRAERRIPNPASAQEFLRLLVHGLLVRELFVRSVFTARAVPGGFPPAA